MASFYGRSDYLDDLSSLWRKRTSSIVACRGRRRIGKSTLIREFARQTSSVYIEIEGLSPQRQKPMTNQDQLDNFIATLSVFAHKKIPAVDNWLAAFAALDELIDDHVRTVILLDQVSWMGGYDPNFPGILRNAWETFFHRHDQLVVVVCGSVSTWIRDNILGDTGFAGRFSRDYVLPELSMQESSLFWGSAIERLSPREILDVLSVTGGIPRYLEEMDPGLSADENIRRTCFLPSGELYKDFDAIFNPLYGSDIPAKVSILEALADGPLTGAELSSAAELCRNGRLSDLLKDLSGGGFITPDLGKNPETGKESRIFKYRLRDNYTRFYLKYIEPHRGEIERGSYRYVSLDSLPGWETVRGLLFENLIVNNANALIPFLGIGNAIIESAAPYRNVRKGPDGQPAGLQIDLLVQTACTAYVIEIKRRRYIGPEVEDEVRQKIKRLPLRKDLSVRPALVYDGELAPSVEGRGFFDAIIPASRLLRP